jgi:hypothetical protein
MKNHLISALAIASIFVASTVQAQTKPAPKSVLLNNFLSKPTPPVVVKPPAVKPAPVPANQPPAVKVR